MLWQAQTVTVEKLVRAEMHKCHFDPWRSALPKVPYPYLSPFERAGKVNAELAPR